MRSIKVIAFDADDTLWVNETNFQETEQKFCSLLESYSTKDLVSKELFNTEMKNLSLYGYGAKSFILSMIETAITIAQGKDSNILVQKILELGKELLQKPIVLLDGVKEVLSKLNKDYILVVATKGDLLDQEKKLISSGLNSHFHHIEVMSDKQKNNYSKLLKNIDCNPDNFLMVGNSLKSDIIPVLELGGHAIYIPFHTTWQHEKVDIKINDSNFTEVNSIKELLTILP